jgi:hypothetical protein
MRNYARLTAILAVTAGPLAAQQPSPARATPPAAAARPAATAAQQIAAAVLPLPDSLRAGARVYGYTAEGAFAELRPGTGTMTCLISKPGAERFQVACYHNTMEPYMARGRELRAQGVADSAVDRIRKEDVLAGRIRMPPSAALYSLNGPGGAWDPSTNALTGVTPLYVVYLPFATEASTGISATPARGRPWLMHPGEPGAHVMYVPERPAAAPRP